MHNQDMTNRRVINMASGWQPFVVHSITHVYHDMMCKNNLTYHDRKELRYPPGQKLRQKFFYTLYDNNSHSFEKFGVRRSFGMFSRQIWIIFHDFQVL